MASTRSKQTPAPAPTKLRWSSTSPDGQLFEQTIKEKFLANELGPDATYQVVTDEHPELLEKYETSSLRNAFKRLVSKLGVMTVPAAPAPTGPPPGGALAEFLPYMNGAKAVTPRVSTGELSEAPLRGKPKDPSDYEDDGEEECEDNTLTLEVPREEGAQTLMFQAIMLLYLFHDINREQFLCVLLSIPTGIQGLHFVVKPDGKTLSVTGYADPLFSNVGDITSSELEAKAMDDALKKYRHMQDDPVKVCCDVQLPKEVVRQNPFHRGLLNQETGARLVYIKMACVVGEDYCGKRNDVQFTVVRPKSSSYK